MILRPYQKKALDDIEHNLKLYDKIVFQLPTGGGKTFIFCNLIKRFPDKKILILVNRQELVLQTINSLGKFGITAEQITSKTKALINHADCYVAMERSLWNRLEKIDLPEIDLLIIDECHIANFDKFIPKFKKVIGFTATPVRLERLTYFKCLHCDNESENEIICHNETMQEWSREHLLSKHYENIVLGPPIAELIDEFFLMPEVAYAVKVANLSGLTIKGGEYTEQSINDAYISSEALFNVVKNYNTYCKDLKTIIFNGSVNQSKAVYNAFLDAGITNIKSFDSVNQTEPRAELVKWFKETDGAILTNVNVFTTGFDVTDVGAIIVNRPTQSLSLWLQIVGRGARPAPEKGKSNFLCIDGGGNIERLGKWSDIVDWQRIFFKGLKPPKAKKEVLMDVKECQNCSYLIAKTQTVCPSCGHEQEIKRKIKNVEISDEVAKLVTEPPKPNGKKIIAYCKINNLNQGDAFKIMINQFVDLFRLHNVKFETYNKSKINSKLDVSINRYLTPAYHQIIKSDLPPSGNKTLQNTYNRIIKSIEKYYGII